MIEPTSNHEETNRESRGHSRAMNEVLTLSDDHVYRFNNQVVAGTTEAINAAIPRRWEAGKYYLTRGSALHKAIQLLAKNDLDPDSVEESYKGKLAAYQKFMQETAYHTVAVEKMLFSSALRFAGTIDALMLKPDLVGKPFLVDFKSSLEPQVEVQLGAYRRLLWDNGQDIAAGLALELHDDGTYKCAWFTKAELKRAEQTFHACLTIYGFLQKHKLNTERK